MAYVATQKTWAELDARTRLELDRQYLAELPRWHEDGVTPAGVRAYLEYRHERPGAQITTYEEGQIRKILHAGASVVDHPDPVEMEEHIGWLERFGARRLHLTNDATYVAVMLGLTCVFLVALVAFVIFL